VSGAAQARRVVTGPCVAPSGVCRLFPAPPDETAPPAG
jgi:hypothetical protein